MRHLNPRRGRFWKGKRLNLPSPSGTGRAEDIIRRRCLVKASRNVVPYQLLDFIGKLFIIVILFRINYPHSFISVQWYCSFIFTSQSHIHSVPFITLGILAVADSGYYSLYLQKETMNTSAMVDMKWLFSLSSAQFWFRNPYCRQLSASSDG